MMKFEDLEVGMEVLVLRSGKRSDIANAWVEAATVLSTERWAKSTLPMANRSLAGPDGNKLFVGGRIAPGGKCVPVLMPNNYAMLVMPSRILGPVDEWQPKIDAARRERDTYQRERSERQATQQEMAKQVSTRSGEMEQRIKGVGIAASVRPGGGGGVSIILDDLATAERLVGLLEAAHTLMEPLATEMHDEEARLRQALHTLTGQWYEPRGDY